MARQNGRQLSYIRDAGLRQQIRSGSSDESQEEHRQVTDGSDRAGGPALPVWS